MNFKKIEMIGGPRRCLRVKSEVTFDTKTIVEIPIACLSCINDDKEVKKVIAEFNKKIKTGLIGTPIIRELEDKKLHAFRVLSVKPMVVNNNLVIIGRIKMLDTKYGKKITRGLKHKIMDVFFGAVYQENAGKAPTLLCIESDT